MAETPTLRPGFWMTGNAWLDIDGRHIWFAHDCTSERVVTMLAWPTWHSNGIDVVPSVNCDGCGLHAHYKLDTPPDESHRCMSTFEINGAWCERMLGHDGLHMAGFFNWGSYVRG